jgi:hypothetical protein
MLYIDHEEDDDEDDNDRSFKVDSFRFSLGFLINCIVLVSTTLVLQNLRKKNTLVPVLEL